MTRSLLLRIAQAALLALLLLNPAALAQGGSASIPEDDGGFFASVWSFLTDLLFGEDGLDNRCGIDPDGCPDVDASLDNRCTIDPDGFCAPGS